ncbi:hypothetical protein Tco_1111033 [Tanacetum coccineum]|uniref:COI1 F-box domain-containing protein n=1 Tax=Tanacetum coccineum TaxID=301880 RepID=A0ABQ5ILY7_9ASTR
MDNVLDCVMPYIHDGDDLNSISLVCHKGYELDCITRKHVTVHVPYASNSFRLSQRFPYIESLALKGFPFEYFGRNVPAIQITPWIQEIAVKSFKCLKELYIRDMVVSDSDLELLVRKRGKDLTSLKMYHCQGFSMDGLMHVFKYCNNLGTLWLEGNFIKDERGKDGQWLHELALHNKEMLSDMLSS